MTNPHAVRRALDLWAETVWRIEGAPGRIAAEGLAGAAIGSEAKSRPPPGFHAINSAYVRVEATIMSPPKPAEHRICLAAEYGLLDCWRGLTSQAARAAALHLSRASYCRRLAAVHQALSEHFGGRESP